jgi:hypothetical protein
VEHPPGENGAGAGKKKTEKRTFSLSHFFIKTLHMKWILLKSYHLDVVRGPSTPRDPESDAGGSLSSWQGHPTR